MATTSNFGWTTPDDTDLVKDGALAIRTLGNNIDTSLVDLKGGTTGQILSKNSNSDLDYTWINNDQGDITEVVAGTGLSGGGTSGSVTLTNTVATEFDAKGDLVVGTGADTFDKLTAGANGETLVADSSTSTGLRYNPPATSLANPVINGGFDVWQRGTSLTPTIGVATYTADRWQILLPANVASTISRQTTGDTTNLPNIEYCVRVQRNSGQTGTSAVGFAQSMETTNTRPFAGKAVTLSFYARAGANYSPTSSALTVYLATGTGTDQNRLTGAYTGDSLTIAGTATLTTTWQRFVVTGTVPTTATEMAVYFSNTPTGTAGAADYYEVTGVQIDVGTWTASTAPTFRRSGGTLAGELAACQRYYLRIKANGINFPFAFGQCYSTTTGGIIIPFPVTMRAKATALEQSGTAADYQVYSATGSAIALSAVPTFAGVVTTEYQAAVNITTAGSLAAGNITYLAAANSNAFLGWSAEL